MIKPIYLCNNPRLREASLPVRTNTPIKSLIEDLFETMHKARGVGLSAIQIGIPLRAFVIEVHTEEENYRGAFINPILHPIHSERSKRPEGCLSIPNAVAPVDRPDDIELEWKDEKWIHHRKKFSGVVSRIIQHEMDHLDGVLFIDHLDFMWKELLSPFLERIELNSAETFYLSK